MVVCALRREGVADSQTAGSPLPANVEAAARPLVFVSDDLSAPRRSEGVTLGVHAWSLPACAAELPFAIPEEERPAWEDQEVQQFADAQQPWREKHPEVPVLEDVVLFTLAQALLHCSAGAALVMMGRNPGAEWGYMIRSLLREAMCPVAVVAS